MLSLAAAAFLLSSPETVAARPGMDPAFKNTIVSTYPDGRSAKLWLNRDGSYRGQGRSGRVTGGRWNIRGQQICFRQSRPIPIPKSYCTPLVEGGVGATWSAKAVSGEPLRVTLAAGR